MDEAFVGADIVYPKSWGPLVTMQDQSQMVETIRSYESWICDERRMSLAKEDAIYMHCLPADRGVEVSRRRDRWPAIRRLRSGREPHARPERHHGPHHGRSLKSRFIAHPTVEVRFSAPNETSEAMSSLHFHIYCE